MNLFIDTSSLFKLYHREAGTKEIENVFIKNTVKTIILSEVTKAEFSSASLKKVRVKEIDIQVARKLINAFENDSGKFTFVTADSLIIETAKKLIYKYGIEGLRTLDSIHLATAVIVKRQVNLNICSDILLNKLMQKEGLNIF